jgi:hypothetical protein
MNLSKKQLIYTIGHSTRDIDEFVEMLQSFEIKTLVDIRRFPGSRKYPHFNQETIKKTLTDSGINYIHLEGLGGRRKEIDKSGKSRWRNSSFRSYAAYMETHEFRTYGYRKSYPYRLYVFGSCLVALSPSFGFRLPKSQWLDGISHSDKR